ncbi:MAG: hypothetical protein CUN56_08465 [Phototrophicales bacterium]|nr:MAG: hypothetical protein CUN56_08465 [Phototrophicales bacterium]RMG76908.1 MAG: tetratricopeptide repeat protein [Chloroflexota bacterium]
MKRWIIISIMVFIISSILVVAQEETPDPQPDINTLYELVEQAQAAADRAEAALLDMADIEQQAKDAVGLAGDLFGLFEAMSGAIGLIVPILAIVAGVVGFNRLNNASQELREAREQLEKELAQRNKELDQLRDELQATAQHQRENATAASIALSLLPVGERQYRAQDYRGALDTYQRALQYDPKNPIIHYRLGYVYTQSGELEKAREALQESLRLDEQFAPSRAALGYVYRRIGDSIQKQIDALTKAGTPNDHPEVLKLKIDRDKAYVRSEDLFVDALDTLPKLMDEDGESWWGALGGLYRRRGQVEQAIYAYERGTQVTPQSSYPFSNLALLYAETGQREKMIKTYQRVEQLAWNEVQADVDNYWAYADLIVSRMAQGKVKETRDILNMALETAPTDSPYTLESLIDTLERLARFLGGADAQAIHDVVKDIRHFAEKRQEKRDEEARVEAKRATSELRAVQEQQSPAEDKPDED